MLIAAKRLITGLPGTGVLAPGYLAVSGGRITEVGEGPPPTAPDLDLRTGVLVPGLVDLQVNGYYGVDLADCDPEGWALVAGRLPETGTTAFLPTFITAPVARLATALRSAQKTAGAATAGARVLGVHLEGPFLSPARAGAHRRDWMVPPSPSGASVISRNTPCPASSSSMTASGDGALAAVAALVAAGVVVSVGHSDATAGQVAAAADAGARMVTHLFDAQRGLHHREPGVVGQALTDHRLTSGLIVDLCHVSAAACTIAFAAAPGRICLVTDAAAAAGMPPGRYVLGGQPTELPPGGAAPVRPDGTLAGSALRLDRAVANAVAVGLGLAEAVAAASRIPADLIGRPDLGRLAPGAAADLAWLGDDLRTKATWVGGKQVYGPNR